ncbi:hypothetical protein L7F22_064157 [Adiantum nelumboides]|nr:hypothetical protein [Adiantum nelumboides]
MGSQKSSVLDLLKCYVSEHKGKWEQYLPLVEYAYNNTVHSSTGKASFEIVEGGKKVPPIVHAKDKIFEADKYVQNMDEMYKKVKVALERTQAKQKKAADRHRREVVFSLGDWVLLRFEKARLKKMMGKERLFPKLSMRYYGPFQICDIIGDVAYMLKLPESWKMRFTYRMLSRPYAFGCIYKLRTSPELRISQSYGHFFPDPQYENVQHIICCDVHATYAYDFEFTSSSGFDRTRETLPSLQMAFQYTVMVPSDSQNQADLTIQRKRFTLQRRLRIRSIQIEVARNLGELYESADSEIIYASLEEGIKEARTLLHDWLIILTSQYNEFCKLARFGQSTTMNKLDVTFSHYPKLQVLPHLVFALMRSSLLRPHEEGVHPDYRIYLQCLFSALEPSSLLRAVYPVLSSYSSPDKQAFPRHSLSRAALITSSSPIFFLDAFTVLIVYYTSTSDPALPFPPPQNCLLRSTINKLKWERSITPKLIMIREGHDRTEPFDSYLIEEQDVDGTERNIKKFDDTNFTIWKQRMLEVLVNKGLAMPVKECREGFYIDYQWEKLDACAIATNECHLC